MKKKYYGWCARSPGEMDLTKMLFFRTRDEAVQVWGETDEIVPCAIQF